MSKNAEKKLCQYINLLENLLMLFIDSSDKKNYETQRKLEKLKNLLSKRGITTEEIESALYLINEPFDKNLENLNEDLVNEYIPDDINNIKITQEQKDIINFIEQQHKKLNQLGINLNEEQNKK